MRWRWPSICFIPLQYWLIADNWQSLFAILIPVWAFLLLPVLAAVKGETQDFLHRTARIQWALMLCVFCISHAPALLVLHIPGFEGRNVLLLFFLIAVVQLSDVLQYVFGKLLGRHKVAPRVSPAKTWEGLIGGGLWPRWSAPGCGGSPRSRRGRRRCWLWSSWWRASLAGLCSRRSNARWAQRTGAR